MSIENMFGSTSNEVEKEELNNEVDNTVDNGEVNNVEPVNEVVTEVVTEEPKVRNDNGHMVPLSEYLNTRDQLKELKRYKEEVEAKERAAREQAERNRYAPTSESSAYEIAQWQQQEFAQALRDERLNTSKMYADREHGPDLVLAAGKWAMDKSNGPDGVAFDHQFDQQRDPIGWIVKEYQKEQKVNAVLSDEEAWFKANAAKYGFIPAGVSHTQNIETTGNVVTQPTKLPGSSINGMTSASSAKDGGSSSAIDRMFNK